MSDLHEVGVGLFAVASVLSLVLVVAKPLGREFETVALVWIRALRRIQTEWQKPLDRQLPSKPPRLLNQIHSKRE